MPKQTFFILVALLFLCQCATLPAASTFEDAESALNDKQYEKALTIAKPLAEKGDPKAQTILGDIYHHVNFPRIDGQIV